MVTNASTVTAERLALSVVDPDLADRLGRRLSALTVPVARLEPGPWAGPNGSRGLGVLVARGLLAHVTQLDGQRSVVMAWAGDILLPTGHEPAWIGGMRWTVVERATVALLDPPFMAAVSARPAAMTAVVERLAATQTRSHVAVALNQAPRVEDRLLGTLLLFADERGRMTPDGILVRAFLTHERLGELIGAARPTVSLAFSKLRDAGLVDQRDGDWWIAPDAAGRFFPASRGDLDETLEQAGPLRAQAAQPVARSRRLRERSRRRQRD